MNCCCLQTIWQQYIIRCSCWRTVLMSIWMIHCHHAHLWAYIFAFFIFCVRDIWKPNDFVKCMINYWISNSKIKILQLKKSHPRETVSNVFQGKCINKSTGAWLHKSWSPTKRWFENITCLSRDTDITWSVFSKWKVKLNLKVLKSKGVLLELHRIWDSFVVLKTWLKSFK